MAHLTDMEELLAAIPGVGIRDYMREAMNCYMAGAYRGALVLSFIALFDDLLAKLGELAHVNATARTIFAEATKRRGSQEVYESYLIDQLTSTSLISGLDASFLNTLRTLRNKAAHPSGHNPSPEEARYIYSETIRRFLSQPILSTTPLVDEIILRLADANLFPSSSAPEIRIIVADETSTLHDAATPQLVVKLSNSVLSTDAVTAANAVRFLIGLARQGKKAADSALQSKLITPKASDDAFANVILQLLSINGKLFVGLNPATVARIRAILAKTIPDISDSLSETKLIHPTTVLTSIASAIDEGEFASTFKAELDALFERRAHSLFVLRLVRKLPSLSAAYVPVLLGKAGSSNFETANKISNAAESLDKLLSEILSGVQAFQFLVEIMVAARTGAWAAQGLASAKFAEVPFLRAKALAYIASDGAGAVDYIAGRLFESMTIEQFVASRLTDVA